MIYLDCSYIYKVPSDNAGLQRVTRSITRETMMRRNDICPAALLDDGVFYKLTEIPMPNDAPFSHKGEPIYFKAGDIYFVLDSTWDKRILERLSPLKKYGVTTGAMYHDLIPITHSSVCGINKDIFSEWVLETAKYADFFTCNSNATKESLKREAAKLYPSREINDDIAFSFHLGANISTYDGEYVPSRDALLRAFNGNSTYLIVSTIEPRKNHTMLLDAFDQIWKGFPEIKLCFIGKEGWMIEEVVKRIRSHPMLNSNLFWLEGVNDKDVQWAYRKAKCVLYPSFEEGFGLPIIEALHCGTPVIASDIPVFHEVAGDRIGYLDPHDPMTLIKWVERMEQSGIPKEIMPDSGFKWATWKESAEELLEKIELADHTARKKLAPILKKYAFERRVEVELLRMRNQAIEQSAAKMLEANEDNIPEIFMKVLQSVAQPREEKNIFPKALPIKKLLSMNGRELIRHAYVRILHRLPELEGENSYYEKLLQGFPPISLLSALRFSPEGRRVAEPVKHEFTLRWLGRLLGSQKFPGKIARYIASLFSLSATRGKSCVAIAHQQEQEAQLAEQQKRIRKLEILLQNQIAYANTTQKLQSQKILDQENAQESRLSSLQQIFEEALSNVKKTLLPPDLPFSTYIESEPYLKRAEKRVGEKAPTTIAEREQKFYTYFSELWGDGHEETLRRHYESYLPYLPSSRTKHPFLDIGCGAGEFMSFMQGYNIKTLGIDINETEVERCRERGLVVHHAEAIEFLKTYKGLLSGISLLQVIEHIPQECHIEMLSLAKEKLTENGVLIIETINPAHPLAFNVFFTDPTHLRPISVDYLTFITQWCGFENTGILRLYPIAVLQSSISDMQFHYHNYAIVARKGRKN